MKLRRVTLSGEASVAVLDDGTGPSGSRRWVPLRAVDRAGELGDAAHDVVAFLAGGDAVRRRAAELIGGADGIEDPGQQLPFEPLSFRAFSIWEAHVTNGARQLAKQFFPAPAGIAIDAFEKVARRPFPKLKPPRGFYDAPAFYMGNHRSFLTDGEDLPYPTHTRFLDFELELGFVLAREVKDATPEEGAAAIGGFVVVNDWSARDVQVEEYRHGLFGPVVKTKTFANSMSPVVVTADEVLGRWSRLEGRVRVNGETWCEGTTAGAAHELGALVAHASSGGERLGPGDFFSTGTLPGCCGLELDRYPKAGETVELEIDGVGSVSNRIVDGSGS